MNSAHHNRPGKSDQNESRRADQDAAKFPDERDRVLDHPEQRAAVVGSSPQPATDLAPSDDTGTADPRWSAHPARALRGRSEEGRGSEQAGRAAPPRGDDFDGGAKSPPLVNDPMEEWGFDRGSPGEDSPPQEPDAPYVPASNEGPSGDFRIRDELRDLYRNTPGFSTSQVEVIVRRGEVTLQGTVDTSWQKFRAHQIAERVPGVTTVVNNLRIRDGNGSNDDAEQPREVQGDRGIAGAVAEGAGSASMPINAPAAGAANVSAF